MNIKVVKTKDMNPELKPYLVDVAVKTNVWIRPYCQKKQLDILKKARPSVLFVQSDGGRNEREWKQIRENRRLFDEEIDWDCTVHKIYADKNYGLYGMGEIARNYIWNHTESCIFLEDDHLPAVSFFYFCAEMLKKYADDLRICAICGMNHLHEYNRPVADYFFSHVGSIWGVALWKRTFENFKLDYKNDPYVLDEVCHIAKKDTFFCKSMQGYAENKMIGGHVPGPEYYLVQNIFAQHQLFIVPKKNMISCIGVGDGSTHAVDNIKKLAKGDAQFFYMKTYEIDHDIKHPQYVFPDLTYEKKMKRVTAWHHPVVSQYRRIVSIMKRIRYGEGFLMCKKIPLKIKRAIYKGKSER